jgi:hypothetical protein
MSILQSYLEGSFRPSGVSSSDVRRFSEEGAAAEKEAEQKYGGDKCNTNWIAKLTDYLKQLGIIVNFIPSSSNPNLYLAKIQHMGIPLLVMADNTNFQVLSVIGKVQKQNVIQLFTALLTHNSIVPGVYFSINSINKVQQIELRGGRHLEGLDLHELKILLDNIGRFILQFALPLREKYNLGNL